MWFKKKSQISGFNANMAEDGSDWRTVNKDQSWSVSQTLPSAADAGNYFYLPALGSYFFGQLYDVGNYGSYWSSSVRPSSSDGAYNLSFSDNHVHVNGGGYRNYGYRVDGFE